jgi:hypothetical protein
MEDSGEKSFDPLSRARDVAIKVTDETKASFDPSANDINYVLARKLTTNFEGTVDRFVEDGGNLDKLLENLQNEEVLSKVSNNLEAVYSSDEFGQNGFAGWLTNDSRAQSIRAAEVYLGALKDTARQMKRMRDEGGEGRTLVRETHGLMAREFRNGRLKDSLSILTPQRYRYSANFDRGIQAVNSAIGLSSSRLNFENIKNQEQLL